MTGPSDAPRAPEPGSVRATFAAVAGILRRLARDAGGRLWLALAVLVFATLLEGLSIVLLLPILAGVEGGTDGWMLDLEGRGIAGIPVPALRIRLEWLLAGLVALVALQAAVNRYKAGLFASLLQTVSNKARGGLFRAVAAARWDRLRRLRISDIEHTLTGDIDRLNRSVFSALGMVQSLVGLVLLCGIGLFVSPVMTALAVVFGGAVFAALHVFRRRASRFGEGLAQRRAEQHGIAGQFLHGLETARSMNEEPRHVALFEAVLARTSREAISYSKHVATGNGVFQVAIAVGATAFVAVALRIGTIGLAEIVVMLVLLMRIAPRFLGLQGQFAGLLVDHASLRRVEELTRRLELDAEPDAGTPIRPIPRPRREIRLDRVTYHHESDEGTGEAPIGAAGLTECTLAIPVGEITAVVGRSGSGKSTVAHILTGLLRPQAGALRLDGEALPPDRVRAWRAQIAYVAQDPFLLHDTIRANLRIDGVEADEAALRRALRLAAADEIVEALPDGLDTVVGDRGGRLSGGERQRIALARALLRRPTLLVLDEATSALDWRSQARIADALAGARGETTIFVVAHRPSMVTFADRIYALDRGRVVEEGAPDRLAADPTSVLSRMLAAEVGRPGSEATRDADGSARADVPTGSTA